MVDKYNGDILRVAVAQICQTIGYNNAQTAPVELLQDVLHRYLLEFCRDLRRKTEHANRIEANLKDAYLSMKSLNIDVTELLGYISNVEPVQFSFEVPRYPARKDCKLNFLKPGSKEVLTRPVHIYEYLPPILQPEDKSTPTPAYNGNSLDENDIIAGYAHETGCEMTIANNNVSTFVENAKCVKIESDSSSSAHFTKSNSIETNIVKLPCRTLDDDGRPTREISSVVMTTGGFISPAIEGKLADARIPDIIDEFHGLDAPPPPPPPPLPTLVALETHANVKAAENVLNTNATTTTKLKQGLPNDALFAHDEKSKRRGDYLTKMTVQQSNTFAKQTKKSKKKLANEQQQQQLAGLGDYHTNDLIAKKSQDKTHRKAIKMLQKLNKSVKNNKSENALQFGSLNEHITPGTLAAYPLGSNERNQLEKMLKKQAKQRQKLLKQQQQQQQQQQKEHALENSLVQLDDKYFSKKQTEHEFQISTENVKAFNAEATQPLTIQTHTSEPNTNAFVLSHNQDDKSLNLHEPSNNVDLKLTSEPDRSKLNIFKKLSKQKTTKSVSPNALHALQAGAATADTFANTSPIQPVINLPSGTTITPAPALTPLDAELPNNFNAAAEATALTKVAPTGGLNLYNDVVNIAAAGMLNPDLNKPKKRGRKPGSKNQVKHTTIAFSSAVAAANPAKKTKQNKMLTKHAAFDASNMPNTMEAINLMHSNQFPGALNFGAKPSTSDGGLFKAHDAPPIKEKKERKKYKSKYNPLGLSASEMHGNTTTTKTQADNINNTLLQVAPMLYTPAHKTNDNIGDISSLSPTTKSKSPNQRKQPRTSPQKCSPNLVGHQFMTPAEVMAAGTSALHNKHPNMLPMLPLYPFPPRPGLIPTAPGFFPPPGIANFGNNNAATNLLMPTFLPFPNFNPAANLPNNEHKHNTPDSLSPKELHGERNFCNVAPLIPDTLKLAPQQEQQANAKVDITQTQANASAPDTTKFDQLSAHDALNSLMLQKMKPNKLSGTGLRFNEATLPGKKLLLATATATATATGNADDPIEVSDDSSDTPHKLQANKLDSSSAALQSFHGNLIQPGQLSNIAPMVRDNIFMSNTFQNLGQQKPRKANKLFANKNKSPIKSLELTAASTSSSATTTPTPAFTLDLKGKEKLCLAGGADLIPLMRADSAVTYPPLSNAATTQTNAVLMSQLEAANFSTAQLFEGVTITPTNMPPNNAMDLKRRKEHKKFKKLKEGKIKKKKDKKEKSRSKDRSDEKYLYKGDKLTKDLERKLKKEKKREKQRLLLNSVSTPLDLPAAVAMSASNAMAAACSSKPSVSETNHEQVILNTQSHVAPKAMISPNQLPKITLKIAGNSKCSTPLHFDEVYDKTQSQTQVQAQLQPQVQVQALEQAKRSQSPELARFSPLVTRPPKTKQNDTQSAAGIANTTTTNTITSNNLNASNVSASDMQAISSAGTTTSNIWPTGGTLSASSVLLPQQLLQTTNQKMPPTSTLAAANISAPGASTIAKPENTPALPQVPESNRPSSYVDSDGNTIWICPACGKVDDGSPMIGCDGCDAWYHWVCVGIFVAPKDNEDWFCRVCITRKKVHGNDRKRKRNKKK